MSLPSVCEKLSGVFAAPDLRRSAKARESQDSTFASVSSRSESCLGDVCESRESHMQLHACASARTGAREAELGNRLSQLPRLSQSPSEPAFVLKHCRCVDCCRWEGVQGFCDVLCFRRHVSREDYRPAMRSFWTDLGMIRPDAWHFCAFYDGPQISDDVWLWPKPRQTAHVATPSETSVKTVVRTPLAGEASTGALRPP